MRHRAEELTYTRATRRLSVGFEDGRRFELPSAEVQGHSPSQKQLVAGRRQVGITAIDPVGSYAVRLVFDDLHSSGLYTWDYLYELGEEQDSRWHAYLAAMAERGLSRDPR